MTQTLTSTAREETVVGTGDLNIFVRSWRPSGVASAIVVICHGFNAHSGQYQSVGEQFAAVGMAVYALDLRGRGRSDGERFYVDKFADYVSDLATVIALAKAREPGLSVYLLGHSAGGVVSCVYTLEHQSELAGLICESFAFQVPAPDFAIAVLTRATTTTCFTTSAKSRSWRISRRGSTRAYRRPDRQCLHCRRHAPGLMPKAFEKARVRWL
jgi:acylglycerol lipase